MANGSHVFVGLGTDQQSLTHSLTHSLSQREDHSSPPRVADVFHKLSSQLGHSCLNHRPWEKMRKRRVSRGRRKEERRERGGTDGGGSEQGGGLGKGQTG